MTDVSREEIERLVRRALAQLLAAPASPTVPAKPATDKSETATTQGVLQIDERVVSAGLLEGRLEGVRQLLLRRGAVVTPSARDELKRRGIAVESASGGNGKSSAKPPAKLIVASIGSTDANAWTAALGESMTVEWISPAADLAATIAKWSDAVLGRKTPGVLITDQAAAALVLVNRNHGIRAVGGANTKEMSDAAAAIGANGLVVDPRGKGKFEITTLLRAFAAGAWRNPPDALRRAFGGT